MSTVKLDHFVISLWLHLSEAEWMRLVVGFPLARSERSVKAFTRAATAAGLSTQQTVSMAASWFGVPDALARSLT